MSAICFTGAPATGKTTIIEYIRERGGALLPRHTTRPPRLTDIPGEYEYLPKSVLLEKFLDNEYLEPRVDLLMFKGECYATPRDWIPTFRNSEDKLFIASPPNLAVARLLMAALPDLSWVHLVASPETRRERLIERGISPDELHYRLTAGEPGVHTPLKEATRNIDTSTPLTTVIDLIMKLTGHVLK